jgi:hypothetical protein
MGSPIDIVIIRIARRKPVRAVKILFFIRLHPLGGIEIL